MKKVLIVLLVVLAVVAVAASFFLGNAVKSGVNEFGPGYMGVPVQLADAKFRIWHGSFVLQGLEVGNPNGFNTDHAIKVDRISVDVKLSSLFSDPLVIKRIYIREPDINYEVGLGSSNIGKILDDLKDKDKKEEKKEGRKVAIDDLEIDDGQVNLAAKVTGGVAAPIPLPAIHIKDIGKEGGGASAEDVIKKVLEVIYSSAGDVAKGAGKIVGKGVEEAGKAVGEGAEAVGDAAAEGAKAVGSAAGKAAEGIGNIFGGEKK